MLPIQKEIRSLGSSERAFGAARFFKTGKGEYGEGDLFLGLTVPESRKIAQRYGDLPFSDIETLLLSKYHEERLIALFLLVNRFQKGDLLERKGIFEFYCAHLDRVNNWDLVDTSADKIVGAYLFEILKGNQGVFFSKHKNSFFPCRLTVAGQRKKALLHFENAQVFLDFLITSENLWERRVAMVASFWFIKNGDASLAFYLAEQLLFDTEDLMHKAAGWMLREVGKRVSRKELEVFLSKHAEEMPRTMLRYSLEHFSEKDRKKWLSYGKKSK